MKNLVVASLRAVLTHRRVGSDADERALESLITLGLTHVPELRSALCVTSTEFRAGSRSLQQPDVVGYVGGRYRSAIEVKTRAHVNWGKYGDSVTKSQFDAYADSATKRCELRIVCPESRAKNLQDELKNPEWEIRSWKRWKIVTFEEMVKALPAAPRATAKVISLVLGLTRLS